MTGISRMSQALVLAARVVCAAGALMFAPAVASAQNAKALPADLELVPRDAAGFVHLRVADLFQSEWAKDLRQLVERAGPEAWQVFEKKSTPAPSNIDRITLVMLKPASFAAPIPQGDPEGVSALIVVRTHRPYDRLPTIGALGPREKVYRRQVYYFNEDWWSGLVPIDEQTFLIGSEDALVQYVELSRDKRSDGPLQAALEEANRKHHLVVGLNPVLLGKEEAAAALPPPFRGLLEAHCATFTMDMDKDVKLALKLDYQKQDQAQEGEKALRATLEFARQGLGAPIAELEKLLKSEEKTGVNHLAENFGMLVGLGMLREIDTQLKEAVIQRQGTAVLLPFASNRLEAAKGNMVGVGLVSLAAIQVVGTNVNRAFGQVGAAFGTEAVKDPVENLMKELARGLDRYHDKHGSYPPPAIYDKEGRPLLSWRVALLPFVGEESLYKEFKLDEPWDSLHNKRLIKKLPKALRSPNYYGWGNRQWKTPIQVFTGPDTIFAGPKGTQKPDAAKATALLVHLGHDDGVYWTKPADIAYEANKPVPNLFGKYGYENVRFLLTDGTVRNLRRDQADEKALRALIQRKGN